MLGVNKSIRHAVPADIEAMMRLAKESETASHWRREDYIRIFESGNPSRIALVMEEGVKLSGFVVASHVDREWEVENVVVAAEVQKRGIGSGLLVDLFKRARSEGAESVFLEVRESNDAARALYKKSGFAEVGRRRSYYSAPVEDAVLYRKTL